MIVDPDEEARAILERADVDDAEPPNPMRLALAVTGGRVLLVAPTEVWGLGEVSVGDDGELEILVAAGQSDLERAWTLAHEVAHVHLRRGGWVGGYRESEDAADAIAAALLMPRRAFARATRQHGRRAFVGLADAFSVTETAAALRVGEVDRVPVAVIAPTHLRVRGPEEWAWGTEEELRALARGGRPGLHRARLTDDARRVVLVADEVEEVG